MNKIYILLLALLVMAGCYKDKGNYDYKTMYAIEIDGIDESKKYELWRTFYDAGTDYSFYR